MKAKSDDVMRSIQSRLDGSMFEKLVSARKKYEKERRDAENFRHSTTGWVVLFGGAVVAWRSRKQHSISMSSTEAEIIAASDCALELVYLRGLLTEMGFPQDKPIHCSACG
ncbi:hypothetical protein AB1Y20_001674 [Prymnesium parvum]|uniref:Mitochondrial protein n=1 Tax=Prymnesium parvum TaxID=97485 RepID=A0AB34KD68_PRYPA|mmetsp:Transcript_43573/g.108402  ORF Transcript_43573/g.108402 Transcript_43573/m.108402 type:complete len:111 (+) Transcript_43573:825-1157(+)